MRLKRLIAVILTIALLASLTVFPVSAEEPFKLSLSVTPETVSTGNTIASGAAVTVSVNYENWPAGVDTFKVLLGYDHTKLSTTNSKIVNGAVVAQNDEDTPTITKNNNTSTHQINYSLAYTYPSASAASGTLFTVTFTTLAEITDALSFPFSVSQLYMNSTGNNTPNAAQAPTAVTVCKELTGTLNITDLTVPAVGAEPDTSVLAPANTSTVGSVTWSGLTSSNKFGANSTCTAYIVLAPGENCRFANNVAFTINGEEATTEIDSTDPANRHVKRSFALGDKPVYSGTFPAISEVNKVGDQVTVIVPPTEIPAGETAEYGESASISVEPTTWSESNVLTLSVGEHYVFVRIKETDTHKAGMAGAYGDPVTVYPVPTLGYTAPASLTYGVAITDMTPTVTGGAGSLHYTLSDGTLPAGLTLNAATGVISGAPTAVTPDGCSATVRVSDSEGVSAEYQVDFPAVAKADRTVGVPTLQIVEGSGLYVNVTNPVVGRMYMCLKSTDPAPTPGTGDWTTYTDPDDSLRFSVPGYPPNISYTVYTYAPENEHYNLSNMASASISTPKMGITDGFLDPFCITGDTVWGSTLTARVDKISPSDAQVGLTCQWFRGESADTTDGTPILTATGTDYTLTTEDLGKYVYVVVTANGDFTGSMAAGTATAVTKVDQTAPDLAALEIMNHVDMLIVPSEAGVLYQCVKQGDPAPALDGSAKWKAGTGSLLGLNGLACNTQYTLYAYRPETAGCNASPLASRTDASTKTIKKTLTGTAAIKRGGAAVTTPAYGDVLTADVTGTAQTNVPYTYQWYRGETPIPGAVGESYTVTATDIAQTLKVAVGAAADSDYTGTMTSDPTNAVTKASQTATVPTIATHTDVYIEVNTVAGHLYLCLPASDPAPTVASAGWTDLQTGTTDTFVGLAPNTAYKIYAYLPETATHSASAVVAGSIVTTDQTTIWGDPTYLEPPVYGATLDVYVGQIRPEAAQACLDYQWLRDGVAIPNATGTSYTLTTADVGHRVTVKVTAKADSNYTGDRAGGLGGSDTLVAKATYTGSASASFNVYYKDATSQRFHVADFNLSEKVVNPSIKTDDGTYTAPTDVDGIIAAYDSRSFRLHSNLTDAKVGKTASYTVTISSDNYNDITATVNITAVNKTALTLSPSMNQASYTYGDTVDTAACGIAASAGGTLTPEDALALLEELVYSYAGTAKDGTAYGPSATAPTKAGDYTLTVSVPDSNTTYMGTQTIPFTINRKTVNAVRATTDVITKVYDGSASAPDVSFTAAGVYGETLSITATGNQYVNGPVLSVNAGTNQTIKLGDTHSSERPNYSVVYPDVTGDITPLSVTATLSSPASITKEYDGTTSVGTLTYSFAGVGETVAVAITGSTYDNKNAGTSKAITLGDRAPACANPDNYDITYESVTGSITPKSVDVTINGVDAADYDPTATAETFYHHTATYPTCAGDTAAATVQYTPTSSTNFPEAGEYQVNATITDANYSAANVTGTTYFTIDKLNITTLADDKYVAHRAGLTGDKTYDLSEFGTMPTTGTVEVLNVLGAASALTDMPTLNAAKTQLCYTLSGTVSAGQPGSTTEAVVTLKFTPDKNYNAKFVTLHIQIVAKNPAAVSVSQTGWTYGNTAPAVVKSVNITDTEAATNPVWRCFYEGTKLNGEGYTLTDVVPTDPGTYTVTAYYEDDNHKGSNTSAEFTIAPKALTYGGGAVKNKEFDNKTTAVLDTALTYVGVVPGDTVTQPLVSSIAFADAAVGSSKTVNITTTGLFGTDAWKYTAPATLTRTANITPATKPVLMTNDAALRIVNIPADIGNMGAQIQASYTDVAAVKKAAETEVKTALGGITGSELYDVRLQENGAGGWTNADNRPVSLFFPFSLNVNTANAQVMLVRVNNDGTMTPVSGVTKDEKGLSVTTNGGVFAMVWYEPTTGNDGYAFLEGANGVFDGKSAVKFCIDHTDKELLNVYLIKDGTQKLLTKGKDYTVKAGSTIITLTSSCVKKMSDGGYMLYAAYKNGYASTYFNLYAGNKAGVSSAETGDMGVALYAMMALSSAAGAVWVARKKKEDQ